MEEVLEDIGLGHLKQVFERHRITPRIVLAFTEEEFAAVGITSIGDRVRLRERCQHIERAENGETSSPVLRRIQEFQSKRRRGNSRTVNNRKPKDTRRITIGWKHQNKGCSFQLVSEGKGGGKYCLDVEKNTTLPEMHNQLTHKFFPDGKNFVSGLLLCELDTFLATFTGKALPERLLSGQLFTIGEFIKEMKTSPLRLYLHTSMKEVLSVLPAQENHQALDILETSGTSRSSANSSVPSVQVQIHSSSVQPSVVPADVLTVQQTTDNDTHYFVDDRSPTIQFRARNRLSLSRRTAAEDSLPLASTSSSAPRSQYELIEVWDSEDDELEQAIQASLIDLQYDRDEDKAPREEDLKTVLDEFVSKTQEETKCSLLVSRRNVLDSTLRAFQRPSMKFTSRIYIKFSGEIGEDYGGPRREYFRLAIDELHNSNLFLGKDGNKYLNHDLDLLESGQFRMAGRLVALSFLQDGPGPRFLNGNVFDLITYGETDLTNFDIDMLPFDIKTIVQQLKDVNSDEDREAFLASHGDWLVENGLTNIWRLKCEEKEAVIQKIIKQVIYYRCSAEIADFIVGLNDVGNFFDLVKRHPRAFKEEFCCKPEPLTMDSFQNVYTVIYSEVGSNDKVKEDETIYAWELFLQDIEEKAVDISFEDLLGFATGANKIPPRGFQKPLEIHFFSEINRLPCVSTCAMELYLPRGIKEPKVFNDKMYMAIKGSLGFDKI